MENPEESAQEGYGAEDSVVSGLVKSLGETARQFEVKISFDIIRLFSEGLYQSPHKAIEELVSNSVDAGALNVHLLVPEPSDPAQSLWVIDDGSGMSHQELETLWEGQLAQSTARCTSTPRQVADRSVRHRKACRLRDGETLNPESTEGGRRVSVLRRQEGAPVLLG